VKFLDVVNQTLYDNLQRMDSDKNMSLTILDYAGGVLKLSGQHEEMIVVRADGKLECIDTRDLGFPIGLVEEIGEFIASSFVPQKLRLKNKNGSLPRASDHGETTPVVRMRKIWVCLL
jgi:serine phosphatase RsbU (regulator of sigma subunit)